MKPFAELTEQGQVRRLRDLAWEALANYDLGVTEMVSLHHGHNTTFRVAASRQEYTLRINNADWRSRQEIDSEATWLAAIHDDTDLVVPQPVANGNGEWVTRAGARGVPEERDCVLFHWVEGQFYRKRLSPVALERVGRLAAHLHNHVEQAFEPAADFSRPSVQWGSEEEPGDMERVLDKGLQVGAEIIAPEDLATFTMARYRLREEMAALERGRSRYNLIHADLHHGNCLFYDGEARAIDFDDCGWGHFLYDLAVTEWYLQARSDFAELQAAHLDGYRQVRPLSEEDEALLPLFTAARTLMMAAYMASRKDNPRLWKMAPAFIERCAENLRYYLREETRSH